MILNAASDSSALYVLACVDQHCQHWWNLRPQNWDGQMRKILYLCIISPVGLLQKKRTTFIFRHSDHTKATFTFNELLSRRHLLQIGNETKIIAGSKDISSNVCRPQSTSSPPPVHPQEDISQDHQRYSTMSGSLGSSWKRSCYKTCWVKCPGGYSVIWAIRGRAAA